VTLRVLLCSVLLGLAAAPARAAPGADPGGLRWPPGGSFEGARERPAEPFDLGLGLDGGDPEPTPITDWTRALPGRDAVADGEGGRKGADPEDRHVPRLRLEAYLRVAPLVNAKVKHGPQALAHAWSSTREASVPNTPALGQRWLIDLKVHRWLTAGVAWSQLVVEGPRRGIHFRGISHAGVYFAPDSLVATTIDVQTGEAWLRLVVADDDRVRFMIGVGAVWGSVRTTFHRGDLGAGGRVETIFTPTLSYLLAVRLGTLPASVFVESVTAPFAPWRFPSLFSETRAGLRIAAGGGVELILSLSFVSGQIADTDDLWGGRPSPRKRFRMATWYAPAAEFGVAWTFG
jgi:hypothetical protein